MPLSAGGAATNQAGTGLAGGTDAAGTPPVRAHAATRPVNAGFVTALRGAAERSGRTPAAPVGSREDRPSADEPHPCFALEEGETADWADFSTELRTRLRALTELIDEQHRRPFRAGQLQRDVVVRVLNEIDPSGAAASDLPRWPVEIEDLSSAAERPMRESATPVRAPDEATTRQLEEAWSLGVIGPMIEAPCLLSPSFVVAQDNGDRLIFDCRKFNASLDVPTFALNTIFDVPALAGRRSRYAFVVDLRKGYFQIALADSLRRFMGVRMPETSQHAAYAALPMGLAEAPRLFQRITGAFVRAWQAVGIVCSVYLDDFIVMADSPESFVASAERVVRDLLRAGWRLSPAKVRLAPHRTIRYLGMLVDLRRRAFAVPPAALRRLQSQAADLAATPSVPVAALRQFAGRAQFAAVAFPPATFFLPDLWAAIASADTEGAESVPPPRAALLWWSSADAAALLGSSSSSWYRFPGSRLWVHHRRPAAAALDGGVVSAPADGAQARSDASDSAVGYTIWLGGSRSRCGSVPLPVWLRGASSTAREIYGLAVAVMALPRGWAGVVSLVCDNAAAVGTAATRTVCAATAPAARLLLRAILFQKVTVRAEWAPRESMGSEDALSRACVIPSHMDSRPPRVWWQRLADLLGRVDLEPFTGGVPVHPTAAWGSRWPLPGSVGDGLAIDWGAYRRVWAFPPFALAPAVVRKVASAAGWRPAQLCLLLPMNEKHDATLRRLGFHSLAGPALVEAPLPSADPLRPADFQFKLTTPSRPLRLYIASGASGQRSSGFPRQEPPVGA